MPADPPNELRAGTAEATVADDVARLHGGHEAAAEGVTPAKPKRKRAPRKTFEDGSLTRVFKFPSKKHPKSSYYVTGDEIIIRIKKARKRWKLIVPKKRLVSYRTNRWFAKPRWVEIELTYTQAVRQGLVEPVAKPSPSELPSEQVEPITPESMPVSAIDADHLLPALDSATLDDAEADSEAEAEADAEEFSGWVADDDASAPGHEEAFETFEDALAEDAEEAVTTASETGVESTQPIEPVPEPHPEVPVAPIAEVPPVIIAAPAEPIANEPQLEDAAPETAPATPDAVASSPLLATAVTEPVITPSGTFTADQSPPVEAANAAEREHSSGSAHTVSAAAPDLQEDIVPSHPTEPTLPDPARLPTVRTQRKRRYLGAQLLAASLALAVIGWNMAWQPTPDPVADHGGCSAATPSACTDHDIVTGSIGVSETPSAPAAETAAIVEPAQQSAPDPAPEQAAAPPPSATIALLPAEVSPPERIQVESAPLKPAAPSIAVPIPDPPAPPASKDALAHESAAQRNEAPSPGVVAPIAMAAATEVTVPPRQPPAPAVMRPCVGRIASITRDLTVQFGFASASLTSGSQETLGQLAAALKSCGGVRMIIEGHTDSDGDNLRNQLLSLRRAIAVWRHLVDAGAGDSQLVVIGYGQERPLVPNDSDANKSRNRRIKFVVE